LLPASGTTPSSIRAAITPQIVVVTQPIATPPLDAPVLKSQRARNDPRDTTPNPSSNQSDIEPNSSAPEIASQTSDIAAKQRQLAVLNNAVLRASVARLRMLIAPAPPDGFNDAERAARRTGEQLRALVRGSPDEVAALVVARIASRTVDISA